MVRIDNFFSIVFSFLNNNVDVVVDDDDDDDSNNNNINIIRCIFLIRFFLCRPFQNLQQSV